MIAAAAAHHLGRGEVSNWEADVDPGSDSDPEPGRDDGVYAPVCGHAGPWHSHIDSASTWLLRVLHLALAIADC